MGIKTGFERRWQENIDAWTFTPTQTFGIVLMVVAVIVGGWGFAVVASDPDKFTVVSEFYANISSELFSIVITVLVLDQLNRARDKREREANQKALDARLDKQELTRLTALMGSNESVVTKIAVAELKAKGWLSDGVLAGADLMEANLEGAELSSANLVGVFLTEANLESAYLRRTNLRGAELDGANLKGAQLVGAKCTEASLEVVNLSGAELEMANLSETKLVGSNLSDAVLLRANLFQSDLRDANLSGAYLTEANLIGATLIQANLSGAMLRGASLIGADLRDANFDVNTILPDGSNWSKDVDMEQFTSFWHPSVVVFETYWDSRQFS